MKIKRYIFLVAALLLMGQGASAWSGSGNSASDPILIANANDWNIDHGVGSTSMLQTK